MADWHHEFLALAIAHLIGVASPGPDFAVVVNESLRQGRRAGRFVALGIGTGIAIHVGYCLLGLGVYLQNHRWLYEVLRYVGAAYLVWLGIRGVLAKPGSTASAIPEVTLDSSVLPKGWRRACWLKGFLTNVTNVKALMFFIALFSVVVSPEGPAAIKLLYWSWLVFATIGWFILIAELCATRYIRVWFGPRIHWLDRAVGVVLLALAVRVFWSA